MERGRWEIANNGALCISNATRDDTGNYTCHVVDTSLSYQLSVLGKHTLIKAHVKQGRRKLVSIGPEGTKH